MVNVYACGQALSDRNEELEEMLTAAETDLAAATPELEALVRVAPKWL